MNAKELTNKMFTNLLDGKVYNASVTQIIEYYVHIINNKIIFLSADSNFLIIFDNMTKKNFFL